MSQIDNIKNKLNQIKQEKDTKIIPENIKKGVEILNVTGSAKDNSYKMKNKSGVIEVTDDKSKLTDLDENTIILETNGVDSFCGLYEVDSQGKINNVEFVEPTVDFKAGDRIYFKDDTNFMTVNTIYPEDYEYEDWSSESVTKIVLGYKMVQLNRVRSDGSGGICYYYKAIGPDGDIIGSVKPGAHTQEQPFVYGKEGASDYYLKNVKIEKETLNPINIPEGVLEVIDNEEYNVTLYVENGESKKLIYSGWTSEGDSSLNGSFKITNKTNKYLIFKPVVKANPGYNNSNVFRKNKDTDLSNKFNEKFEDYVIVQPNSSIDSKMFDANYPIRYDYVTNFELKDKQLVDTIDVRFNINLPTDNQSNVITNYKNLKIELTNAKDSFTIEKEIYSDIKEVTTNVLLPDTTKGDFYLRIYHNETNKTLYYFDKIKIGSDISILNKLVQVNIDLEDIDNHLIINYEESFNEKINIGDSYILKFQYLIDNFPINAEINIEKSEQSSETINFKNVLPKEGSMSVVVFKDSSTAIDAFSIKLDGSNSYTFSLKGLNNSSSLENSIYKVGRNIEYYVSYETSKGYEKYYLSYYNICKRVEVYYIDEDNKERLIYCEVYNKNGNKKINFYTSSNFVIQGEYDGHVKIIERIYDGFSNNLLSETIATSEFGIYPEYPDYEAVSRPVIKAPLINNTLNISQEFINAFNKFWGVKEPYTRFDNYHYYHEEKISNNQYIITKEDGFPITITVSYSFGSVVKKLSSTTEGDIINITEEDIPLNLDEKNFTTGFQFNNAPSITSSSTIHLALCPVTTDNPEEDIKTDNIIIRGDKYHNIWGAHIDIPLKYKSEGKEYYLLVMDASGIDWSSPYPTWEEKGIGYVKLTQDSNLNPDGWFYINSSNFILK